jgi:hypothetical protein
MQVEKYIAMLDVLGFSDVVNNSYPPHLTQIIQILQGSTALAVGFQTPQNVDEHHSGIDASMLSDTIALWTFDDSALSLQHLMSTVRELMFSAFNNGLPLRGAISVGSVITIGPSEITPSVTWNKMVFGKAVIEAHRLERSQDWSGCVLSESVLCRYTERNNDPEKSVAKAIEAHKLLSYGVPWKSGCSYSNPMIVINWIPTEYFLFTHGWSIQGLPDEEIKDIFARNNKNIVSEDTKRKLENTINFIHHVRDTINNPAEMRIS